MLFFIRTFGCQMNKADSEIAAGTLLAAGYQETADPRQADVVIVNTCAVRGHAVDRLHGYINSIKSPAVRKGKPILAVGGCVAEQKGAALWDELPQTDVIFGTRAWHMLPQAVERVVNGERQVDLVKPAEPMPAHPLSRLEDPVRAWLPISRGCDNFCSYCVVPLTRGRETSRPLNTVIADAISLVKEGVKEITLLGQNVNSYGNELGEKALFGRLLGELAGVSGLRRVRFLTSHPKDLSDATIEAIAKSANACEYVHLPLQAGSDRVLAAMNRQYTFSDYLARIEALRQAIPGVALSTDLIVGFPGETEDEFNETLAAVETVGYDSAYTFIYSSRPGTAAARLPDKTPWRQKEARLRRLIELQSELGGRANRAYLGRRVEVFVNRRSRRDAADWTGRTRTNKIVNFPSRADLAGRFVSVEITGAGPASLTGALCGLIE